MSFFRSTVVPIDDNGTFLGIVGCDFDLDFLQKRADEGQEELFGGLGELFFIFNQGTIVGASGKDELVGKIHWNERSHPQHQ